jgi:glycine/D-amino acid oxidase-like deaminating enzyme
MQKITIRNNEKCVINWNDLDNFLDHELVKTRKLWKIMFEAAGRNEEAIEAVKLWLANHTDTTAEKAAEMARLAAYAEDLKAAAKEAAVAARHAKDAYNKSKRHNVVIGKLREEFQRLMERYWF